MFDACWKVAWRNLRKYKFSAGIGIAGLAVGLLCFVLCHYCARLVFAADSDFPNYGRIAEVLMKSGDEEYWSGTPAGTGEMLRDVFPGKVACYTSMTYPAAMNVTFEGRKSELLTYVINTVETDTSFKDVFSVRLREGNWEQVFRQTNAVVLSRSMTRKIYGDTSPLGKVFHPNAFTGRTELKNYTPEELAAIDYTIVGVMEDLPVNASFSFLRPVDALLFNDAYGLFANEALKTKSTGCNTYALLHPGVTPAAVDREVELKKAKIWNEGGAYIPAFTPIGKEYLRGYRLFAIFYWGIGMLILLVALLNFFTFITGNFFGRLKEFSIRKGLGEKPRQLFGLLFTEFLLFLIPVILLVFCLVEVFVPSLDFSLVRWKVIFVPAVLYRQLMQYLAIGLFVCAGVCWLISKRLGSIYVLHGIQGNGKYRKYKIRNFLLGIQLLISVLFLTGSLAMYLQSRKTAGNIFPWLSQTEKERIIQVCLDYPQLKKIERTVLQRFTYLPQVTDVLEAERSLITGPDRGAVVLRGNYREFNIMQVGANCISFFHLPLLAGRVFRHPGEILVDPEVGKWIGGDPLSGELVDYDSVRMRVCGITEIFPVVYNEGKSPTIWTLCRQPAYGYVKTTGGNTENTLLKVKQILEEYLPETLEPEVKTLAQVIDESNVLQYKFQSMLTFFTIVCLVITVLGIYSAITMDTRHRQKEMSIRKINGAPTWSIALLFVRLYCRLLGISFLLTFPILWVGIRQWLSFYTIHFYHGIGFWLSIVSIMVAIVGFTVFWKVREIIRIDPVEVLKNE